MINIKYIIAIISIIVVVVCASVAIIYFTPTDDDDDYDPDNPREWELTLGTGDTDDAVAMPTWLIDDGKKISISNFRTVVENGDEIEWVYQIDTSGNIVSWSLYREENGFPNNLQFIYNADGLTFVFKGDTSITISATEGDLDNYLI